MPRALSFAKKNHLPSPKKTRFSNPPTRRKRSDQSEGGFPRQPRPGEEETHKKDKLFFISHRFNSTTTTTTTTFCKRKKAATQHRREQESNKEMKLVPLQSFSLLLSSLLLLLLTVVEPSTQFRQEAVLTNGRAANRMAEDEPPPDSLLSRRQNRFFQEAEDDQEPDRFEQDSSNRFFRERGEELKRFQREERERQMEAAAARLQMEDANDGYRAEKNDYTRDGDGYRSQARLEEEGDDNGDGEDDSLVRELAAMQDKSNPDDFQVNRRVKSEREEELMAMLQNEQFSKPPADVISQNEQFSKPPAKKPQKK